MVQFLEALAGLYSPDGEYEGQGSVEYGLVSFVIGAACVVVVVWIGFQIKNFYEVRINSSLVNMP